jgi:hypothetical protein
MSEKLLDIEDDETTTLNLIHDSLEARMTLLKTIEVSYVDSFLDPLKLFAHSRNGGGRKYYTMC